MTEPEYHYDDELIIPIEKLREFAAAYPHHLDYELLDEYAEIARVAMTERGWQSTEEETPFSCLWGLHLTYKYLKDKSDFTPEELTQVAAALRDVGRDAHQKMQRRIDHPEWFSNRDQFSRS